MTDQKVIKREETDPAYTWAVEDLYKKEADWEAEYALLSSRIPEMESFRGHLERTRRRCSICRKHRTA